MDTKGSRQQWGGIPWWGVAGAIVMVLGTAVLLAIEPTVWRLALALLALAVAAVYVAIARTHRTGAAAEGLCTRAGKQHRSIPWDQVRDVRSPNGAPLAPAHAELVNGERLPLPGVMGKDSQDVLAWRPKP